MHPWPPSPAAARAPRAPASRSAWSATSLLALFEANPTHHKREQAPRTLHSALLHGVAGGLTASHIIPWAEDAQNRLNPKNGLCLNALHDRAFDRHLMWIEEPVRRPLFQAAPQNRGCLQSNHALLNSFERSRLFEVASI